MEIVQECPYNTSLLLGENMRMEEAEKDEHGDPITCKMGQCSGKKISLVELMLGANVPVHGGWKS